MEHIYAVENQEELLHYQRFHNLITHQLDSYIDFLKNEYHVIDLPRTVVWTSAHTATHLISNIPVPAYTNDYRIIMTPNLDSWRDIYLQQLVGYPEQCTKIREYYANSLSQTHLLQILGHELAHHIPLFSDESEDSMWFEEGMAEYISRQYFLSPVEFEAEADINQQLVQLFFKHRGSFSLENFSPATYQNDYAGIFVAYWSSFLAVRKAVEKHNGNILSTFASYHKWLESDREKPLTQWFHIDI